MTLIEINFTILSKCQECPKVRVKYSKVTWLLKAGEEALTIIIFTRKTSRFMEKEYKPLYCSKSV